MSVAFQPGYQLQASDLKIIIRNPSGVPVDPYYVRYSIFDYTTGMEVLMGVPDLIPATSGTGQYYANYTIPLDANIGDWIIRWHFNETPITPLIEVVQEFTVVGVNVQTSIAQTNKQDVLVKRLRIVLRDYNPDRNFSILGSEKIDVKVGQEIYTTTMEELYNTIKSEYEVDNKKNIYKAFLSGDLLVKSVSKDKRVEWKKVLDVTKHDVQHKNQFRISIGYASCTATGDHSLFKDFGSSIQEYKTGDFKVGEDIVCVDGEKVINKKILSNLQVPSENYMYDLTVEDNENFVLKSGILAHNTFRPPSSEKFMQTQTQVFGYIWEDVELYEFLLFAIDDLNSSPPVTGVTLDNLPDRWRSAIITRAAAAACSSAAMTWAINSFDYSISGVSLNLQDKVSSYQSMQDKFMQEWDQSRELIKRSIKIIKGLNQPRYGIGISSALGPFSRPGTQSRRNWSSGARGGWS